MPTIFDHIDREKLEAAVTILEAGIEPLERFYGPRFMLEELRLSMSDVLALLDTIQAQREALAPFAALCQRNEDDARRSGFSYEDSDRPSYHVWLVDGKAQPLTMGHLRAAKALAQEGS